MYWRLILITVMVILFAGVGVAKEKPQPDVDKAKAVIKADQEQRVKEFAAAYEALVKKYNVYLEPQITITPRGTVPQLVPVPKE